MDSFVNLAVLSKHRSSAYLLNAVARRISALELAAFVTPLYGFTPSERNPADGDTRW